jgi:PAS domain S-box-containing protein
VLVHRGGQALYANAAFGALTGCAVERDLKTVQGLLARREWRAHLAEAPAASPRRLANVQGAAILVSATRAEVDWRGEAAWMDTLAAAHPGDEPPLPSAMRKPDFASLVENAPQGVYVHRDFKLLYLNRALARMLGYASPEEALKFGQPLSHVMPEEREQQATRARDRLAGEPAPEEYDLQLSRVDGSRFWSHCIQTVVPWKGEPAILVSVTDITARKRAEEDYRSAALKLKQAEGIARVGHGEWDLRAQRMYWSDELYRICGLVPGKITLNERTALAPLHSDDALEVRRLMINALRHPHSFDFGHRVVRPDGSIRHCVSRVTVEADAKGLPLRMFGVVMDVTEMREAEMRIKSQEQMLRAIIDTIPYGLAAKDAQGRYILVNRALERLHDAKEKDFQGRTALELPFFPHWDSEWILRDDLEVIRSGRTVDVPEREFINRRGETTYRRIIRSPIVDDAGRSTGLVMLTEDITRRKKAEDEVKRGRALLQTVFDTVPHRIWVKNLEGRFLLVNQQHAAFYGLTPEQMAGLTTRDLPRVPEALKQQWIEDDAAVLTTGRRLDRPEIEIQRPDGSDSWIRLIKLPLPDGKGGHAGVVGWVEDVTDRVQAERALTASRRLLRTVVDTIPHGLAAKDREGRFILANKALEIINRMTESAMLGRTIRDIAWMRAEDAARIQQSDRTVLESGQPLVIPRAEIHLPDGAIAIRRSFRSPILGADGEVTGLVLLVEDVTDQVRTEEELRSSQRLLRAVVDTIPYSVVAKDLNGRYLLSNRAAAAAFGRQPADLIGRTTLEAPWIEPSEARRFHDDDMQVLRTGRLLEIPQTTVTLSGAVKSIRRIIKAPILDEAGQVRGMVALSEDITGRVRAEEELRTSQRLLRAIFDHLPFGLAAKDREGRFVLVNRWQLTRYGLPEQAWEGNLLSDVVAMTPAARERYIAQDEEVLRTGRVIEYPEQEIRFTAGDTAIADILRFPLLDEQGQTTGLVAATFDVTRRKTMERELRQSRALLQAMFDALPLWVFVKDRERRVVAINRRMAEDYGIDLSQPGPIDLARGLPEDVREQIARFDNTVLESGQPFEVPELPFTLPGQDTRIIRVLRLPLRDASGIVTGLLGVSEDITERHRAALAVTQSQKLESLGVLAGGIAHDFNNLLTGILGNVELAAKALETAHAARRPLENVKNASLMAAGLTQQMLAYSGGGAFEAKPVDVSRLAEDMVRLLQVAIPRNATFVRQLPSGLPAAFADPSQLQQVVMNLVSNAAEAIGDQPGQVTLTTGLERVTREDLAAFHLAQDVPEGEYVTLDVTDTGAGMAPGTLDRIFDPFFSTKFTGRGLGLAVVLGIVRSHKGAIRVRSQPGGGTSFRVLLPPAPQPAPAQDPAPVDWRGSGTVLVVDDDAAVREVAALMLRQLGLTALEAGSVAKALDVLKLHAGDVHWALLDAGMPGPDGAGAVRALRDVVPDLTVVVMSGHSERELLERFSGMNIRGFLQKPFTFDDLQSKLAEWLAKSHNSPASVLPA